MKKSFWFSWARLFRWLVCLIISEAVIWKLHIPALPAALLALAVGALAWWPWGELPK